MLALCSARFNPHLFVVFAAVLAQHVPVYRPSQGTLDRMSDVISCAFAYTKCVDDCQAAVAKAHDFVDSELAKLSSTQQRHMKAKAIRSTLSDVLSRVQSAEKALVELESDIALAGSGELY